MNAFHGLPSLVRSKIHPHTHIRVRIQRFTTAILPIIAIVVVTVDVLVVVVVACRCCRRRHRYSHIVTTIIIIIFICLMLQFLTSGLYYSAVCMHWTRAHARTYKQTNKYTIPLSLSHSFSLSHKHAHTRSVVHSWSLSVLLSAIGDAIQLKGNFGLWSFNVRSAQICTACYPPLLFISRQAHEHVPCVRSHTAMCTWHK